MKPTRQLTEPSSRGFLGEPSHLQILHAAAQAGLAHQRHHPNVARWCPGSAGGRVQIAPIPRPATGGAMGLTPQEVEGKGGASGGQTMLGGGNKADRKKAVS